MKLKFSILAGSSEGIPALISYKYQKMQGPLRETLRDTKHPSLEHYKLSAHA